MILESSMKKILLILILLVTGIKAQQPELLWYKLYGGNSEESGRVVREVSDGYVIFGHTRSYGAGYADFYLIKTNKDGVQQWSKTYGGPYDDICLSGDLASDSGFVLVGVTDLDGTGHWKILLIKTDNFGNVLWEKTMGSQRNNTINCIKRDYDNGYIMIGGQQNTSNHQEIILKTDSNGDTLWTRVSANGLWGRYINLVPGIGYITTGYGDSYSFYSAAYMHVINYNGVITLSKYGNADGLGYFVSSLSDSAYIWSYDAGPNVLVKKYNRQGNEIFTKNIAGIYSIVESFDKGILLAGGYGDIKFIKIDQVGNELWSTTFKGSNYNGSENAQDVIQTRDSSFVLVGTTTSFQNDWDTKIILLKYKETAVSDIFPEKINPNDFKLNQNYPNPFNPSTKISWQSPFSGWQTLKVYDVLGNEVATLVNEYRSAGSYEIDFSPASSIKHPASGIYFYRLQAGDYAETKKMVLLK